MTTLLYDIARCPGVPNEPDEPPERIYNWLGSQLSIALFAGSITINGTTYVLAMHEEGQPLVRQDVLMAEAKAKKEGTKQ